MRFFKKQPLIFLLLVAIICGFFIFPKPITAINTDKLSFPEKDTKELLHSLIKIMTEEWVSLVTSGRATEQEMVVPLILRQAIRIDALKYLMVDAPLDVAEKITLNSIKIARLVYGLDSSVIIREIEKATVKMAVNKGMNFLLQNEIRITPGALTVKYVSKNGNIQNAVFQYIITFKPQTSKQGQVGIEIYSPRPIEPPKSKGTVGIMVGTPNALKTNLPPFIVKIKGNVQEKIGYYSWQGTPKIGILFPKEVPDLGFKPLSFFQRNMWKPLQEKIKEVQVVLNKLDINPIPVISNIGSSIKNFSSSVAGGTKNITLGAVNKIKSYFATGESKDPSSPTQPIAIVNETKYLPSYIEKPLVLATPIITLPLSSTPPDKPTKVRPLWDNLVEQFDEIAEQIEILAARAENFVASKIITNVQEKIVLGTSTEEEIMKNNTVLASEQQTSNQNIVENTGTTHNPTVYYPAPAPAPEILISEIQIQSENGVNDEFIELYNPNSFDVSLNGWSIQKQTSSGSFYKKNFSSNNTIAANGYFLITNKYSTQNLLSLAGMQHNSFKITSNNTIYLSSGKKLLTTGQKTDIIDKVNFQSHENGQSIGRKWAESTGVYQDFEVQTPTPKVKNQVWQEPEQNPEPEPSENSEDNGSNDESSTSTSTSSTKPPVPAWIQYITKATSTEPVATTTTTTPATTTPPEPAPEPPAPELDTTPPQKITSLQATTGQGQGEIVLTFHTPADAVEYIIKYNAEEITEQNFHNATNVLQPPTPQAGTVQYFTITQLSDNTIYYFAIKSVDATGNISLISNSSSAETLYAILDVSTKTLNFNAIENGPIPAEQFFSIENKGKVNMSWSVALNLNYSRLSKTNGVLLPNTQENIGVLIDTSKIPSGKRSIITVIEAESAKQSPQYIQINIDIKEQQTQPPPVITPTSTPTTTPSTPTSTPKIVISEVQIKGVTSTQHDFIELFNTENINIDISKFRIKKKSSTGGEYSVRVFPATSTIPAKGYFLWANSAYTNINGITADTTSTQTIAANNSIALFDENNNILDQVAWGSGVNQFVETIAFSENPESDQSLTRKKSGGDYVDTNNNSLDFVIATSSPTNSQGQTGIPPAPIPPSPPPATTTPTSTPPTLTFPIPTPTFTDNGDGTITDSITGLMWPKDGNSAGANNGNVATQQQILAFITQLNLGTGFAGHTDWRLPNYKELSSIIDYNKSAPTIYSEFVNIKANKYWTSSNSTVRAGLYRGWHVDFATAETGQTNYTDVASSAYYLLAVRGPQSASTLQETGLLSDTTGCALGFQNNGTTTKTDLCTGLMWTNTLTGVGFIDPIIGREDGVNYQRAIIISGETRFGYTDWRLPNVRELINISGIASSPKERHWTLTSNYFDGNKKWFVNLRTNSGESMAGTQNQSYYIKLVREP